MADLCLSSFLEILAQKLSALAVNRKGLEWTLQGRFQSVAIAASSCTRVPGALWQHSEPARGEEGHHTFLPGHFVSVSGALRRERENGGWGVVECVCVCLSVMCHVSWAGNNTHNS